ncbi:hypothetical protein DFH06DRAFT_1288685 [Mycena polygramma]|nr:hypothetical protein DFH06DRAFT_1288685 [Mycena polygramma]
MSHNSLPDEIIAEILSPALKVTDDVFSDTGEVSPFAKYSESTSAYLLVCKSWLRVATPLLYNVVIVRSKAQAKALSLALTKDKQLGEFIKKLRVEGGYGPPMLTILKCSPNISDLFLSLELYSSDNTGGLCKGLPLINPSRLILRDCERMENNMVSQLIEALLQSLCKWKRLCVFDCPYRAQSDRSTKIIGRLVRFERLHTLAIPSAGSLSWAYSKFKQCPLQTIHIKEHVWPWEKHCLDEQPALKPLLRFNLPEESMPEEELPVIASSLDPTFTPLAGAPDEVYDAVWGRILYFAFCIPELEEEPLRGDLTERSPLLFVSKAFYRLGRPLYYAHTVLRDEGSLSNFASVLVKTPSIGCHIRSLSGSHWAPEDEPFTPLPPELDSMFAVLSRTNGLVRVGNRMDLFSDSDIFRLHKAVSWNAFVAMIACSGSTLREFWGRIQTCSDLVSATIFSDLTALQSLEWKCGTGFTDLTDVLAGGFPCLEGLRISLASQSFLSALSLMKLNSLRRVVLDDATNPQTFLQVHGSKLTKLHLPYATLQALKVELFAVCPNLTCVSIHFSITDKSPHGDCLHSPQTVPSLVKIVLDNPYWTSDKAQTAAWERFFKTFDPACFPNLHEMEVEYFIWPKNERDIAKSCWVRRAERLLERGVSLTDKYGTKWRSRLKIT